MKGKREREEQNIESINETQQAELNSENSNVGEPLNRVFREARKDTWNKFVNSLNSRTLTKKVCKKFRKVYGN